ncbi:MAG: winged helix-turn-helix transcriptional regulator [Rhodobiaceae bacterium]|nr:winged helix-turn-helix transcriptional regulator [Rhodobiaceae bacterium]
MANDDPFGAIADPTRREILRRLRDGPKPVVRLAEGLPVSRPAVSQHLKVLLDAGLVSLTPKGTSNIYALQKEGFVQVLRWIDEMWAED